MHSFHTLKTNQFCLSSQYDCIGLTQFITIVVKTTEINFFNIYINSQTLKNEQAQLKPYD